MSNVDEEKRAIEEGNKASKRQEARTRLVARQGESILDDEKLDKLIDEEVKRMDQLAQIPEPTVRGHNVHESVAESKDNKAEDDDQIPGRTTNAQNTQNQDVSPSGPNSPTGDVKKTPTTDSSNPGGPNSKNTPTKKSNRQ